MNAVAETASPAVGELIWMVLKEFRRGYIPEPSSRVPVLVLDAMEAPPEALAVAVGVVDEAAVATEAALEPDMGVCSAEVAGDVRPV